MKKNDIDCFYELMSLIHGAMTPNHKPPSPEVVMLYFNALKEFPFEIIQAAFERVIKEKIISTFPLIGEILAAISTPDENRVQLAAHRAFREVCKAAEYVGFLETEIQDSFAEEAARIAFGGIEAFAQMPIEQDSFNRKTFVDIYKKLVAEKIREDLEETKKLGEYKTKFLEQRKEINESQSEKCE